MEAAACLPTMSSIFARSRGATHVREIAPEAAPDTSTTRELGAWRDDMESR